ncbi:MAG: hypothetical protein ACRDQ4_25500 [Pseudonocardiaceae bacterium]
MTSVDLRIAGDVQSCRDCATTLQSLGGGIISAATSFYRARSESETLWLGQGGDAFRDRMSPIATGTDQLADHTQAIGQALHAFADDLSTVRSRMDQARQVASDAGLAVNGDTIEVPEMLSGDTQAAAYAEVSQTVAEARTLEAAAHDTLERKLTSWGSIVEDLQDQWYWLAASNTTGPVGAALAEANKWAPIAETRTKQLTVFKQIAAEAADPVEQAAAARVVGVFEKSETAALKAVSSNAKVGLGLGGSRAGNILVSNASRFFAEGSLLAKIGEKIPFVGLGIAVGQFGFEAAHAKDGGEVAKAAGADLGGFAAGSAATGGLLAGAAALSLAGGPATLVAVGVGVGVAYGVGYVVNHWGEIGNDAGAATDALGHAAQATGGALVHGAEAVDHAVGSAASSVGHFISDLV